MLHKAAAGQVWKDDCYYLNTETGQGMCKFVLVLAVDVQTGDSVTVVFTSRPNGLPDNPACYIGYPRSGYYVGILGGLLNKPTWVDFNCLETLDSYDLNLHVKLKRKTLLEQGLNDVQLCAVIRCVMKIQEDISKLQYRLLGDAIEALGCP
jgi:hypothetical protein